MLEGFICPDKKKILVEDCLNKCPMGERCLTLPTLKAMSSERVWKGLPSTTQLLNGTMLEFLKLTQPYYVDPDSRTFMVAGSWHHKNLEEAGQELGLATEVALSIDRDIFDLLEIEDGGLVLTDYKLWGSFRVAKSLGVVEDGKMPDPSGAVYKSTGKWGKAGSPKMVAKFRLDPGKADNWEAVLQLNRYRVKLADLGIMVHRMQLQVTVRDGGLYIAKNRGVYRNTYRIPVEQVDDIMILVYFANKESSLLKALKHGWEEPCNDQECWEGVRCGRYCDVAEFCPKGRIVKSVNEDE